MNIENLTELLRLCRTCLHEEAINPIFANEMNTANYSEIVFIATDIKIKMDDGLPQNICQNCLNNINNSVNFRKKCKEAEKQLLIMKSKFEENKCVVGNKLELESDIIVNNISGNNGNESNAENSKIDDNNIETMKYVNNKPLKSLKKHGIFCNKNDSSTNINITKNVTNASGDVNTVICNLCNKTIAIGNYDAHIASKHNPTMGQTVMCKYLNKKQLNKNINDNHIKSGTGIIHDNITLYNLIITNKDTLTKPLLNTEIEHHRDNRQINIAQLNDLPNNNNNSLINKSLNSESEDVCNEKLDKDILINVSLNSVKDICTKNKSDDNFIDASLNTEAFCNDKQIIMGADETIGTENVLYNYSDTVSKRVTCKLCQKDLSIRSVDSHMARHHPGADKRRVKCELCDNYVLKSKLNRHTVLMHDSGLICRYCKCKFDSKEVLVAHIGSCTAKKKRRVCDSSRELRECDTCHKTMQKGSLRLHKAIKHAGLRPVCEHCGRNFGNKLRLHDHYRAKHGYEKFKCSYCDFQSACAMSMRNHERRHRGEKPFVCEQCGADFHAAYLLTQHRQSHATDKTFQCDICPASFRVNNTLHMHKRACHSTSKYACIVCARIFRSRHYVVKHLRAVHRFTGPVPPMTPVE